MPKQSSLSPARVAQGSALGITAAMLLALPGCGSPGGTSNASSNDTPTYPTTSSASSTPRVPTPTTSAAPTSSVAPNSPVPSASAPAPASPDANCAPVPEASWAESLLASAEWDLGVDRTPQLNFEVDLNTVPSADSQQYLDLYSGQIDGTNFQLAMNTNGSLTFTRYGDEDMTTTVPGPETIERGSRNGRGVTMEMNLGALEVGHYSFSIIRGTDVEGQTPFDIYVITPGREARYVANVRFDQSVPGTPATIRNGGTTTISDFSRDEPGASASAAIQLLDVVVRPLSFAAVGQPLPAEGASISYGNNPANATMTANQSIHFTTGGQTLRCEDPGSVVFNLQANSSVGVGIVD